jgi:hypothetical protein
MSITSIESRMTFEKGLERISNVCKSLGEVAKALLTFTVFLLAVVAVVQPAWINAALNQFDFRAATKIAERLRPVNATLFDTLKALADAQVEAASAAESAKLTAVKENLAKAHEAAVQQAIQLRAMAAKGGVVESIPSAAWIYVGFLREDRLLPGASHVATQAIKPVLVDGKVTGIREVSLRFDADVHEDSSCRYARIEDEPALTGPPRGTKMMVAADGGKPLRVLSLDSCPGKLGASIWAKVEIPPERVLVVSRG